MRHLLCAFINGMKICLKLRHEEEIFLVITPALHQLNSDKKLIMKELLMRHEISIVNICCICQKNQHSSAVGDGIFFPS